MEGRSQQDLQSILATLSQFTNQGATASTPQPVEPTRTRTPTYAGTHAVPVDRSFSSTPHNAGVEKTQDPRLKGRDRASAASPKPMINPATITTWQDGLRCVTKIAAQNAQFAASIRRMMDEQRSHEMRWYSERQALKQTQATRSSSSAKAASILQSLGAAEFLAPTSADADARKEAELADFDRKIYAAQLSMEEAMTAELKGLGVPFFGTDRNLVIPDGLDVPKASLPPGHPNWGPLVHESELAALRRRMVAHLEDLYRE